MKDSGAQGPIAGFSGATGCLGPVLILQPKLENEYNVLGISCVSLESLYSQGRLCSYAVSYGFPPKKSLRQGLGAGG